MRNKGGIEKSMGETGGFLLRRPDKCPEGEERAWVLVTHGLNLRPSRMREMEDIFLGQGCAVLRVILKGHEEIENEEIESARDWPAVDSGIWLNEVRRCRREAARLAAGRPVFYCGYSLGGLAGMAEYMDALASESAGEDAPPYRGMILITPAVQVRPWAHLVRLSFIFPNGNLPSLAGKYYEARPCTSVGAHQALFGLHRMLRSGLSSSRAVAAQGGRAWPKLPTLIVYDRYDVLTSGPGCLRKLKNHPAFSPRLYRIRAQNLWHHLVIDRRALGDAGWQALAAEIRGFVESSIHY